MWTCRFNVEVGPVVIIRTAGARFSSIPFMSGREMKKLIPIYSEGTIDSDLVQEGQNNLVDYFQKKGFYDIKVTTDYSAATRASFARIQNRSREKAQGRPHSLPWQ